MAQRSMGDRLRDYCIADVWIATARQKTDGASVAPSGLHIKKTPPFLGLRGPPGRLPQAVLPRPLRGLCRCAAAVSQAIHGTAAVRCQSMTDALSSRNRSPIENDGQRAKCGGTRLISGCRMSSRPPGGQSRGVSSPGFPRPSGFGHPGLCLSRPPGGHMQSSLQATVGRPAFRLP